MSRNWTPAARAATLVGLAAAGLGLRLAHLAFLAGEPLLAELFLDGLAYDQAALRLLAGQPIAAGVYFQDPFYPLFLAGIYGLAGHSYQAVRLVQLGLGALVGPLLYLAGERLYGRTGALIAGITGAIYPVAIYYDALVMKESLGLVLAAAALAAFAWAATGPRPALWLLAGLLYGGAILTRGNLLLAVPWLGLWIFLVLRPAARRRRLALVLLFWTGVGLPIAPVALHNLLAGGEPVLLTYQGGANFFLGNNPESDGAAARPAELRATPVHEEDDFRRLAEADAGRPLSARELSAYWMERGRQFWRRQPAAAIGLTARKFRLFWHRYEIPDNYDFYFFRRESPVLRIPLGWWLLAPAAWAGAVLAWGRPRLTFLHVYAAVYCLGVVAFHVYSRYRLAVVPGLILLGAGIPAGLARHRGRRRLLTAAGLATAAACALAWSPGLVHYSEARLHLFRGVALTHQARWGEAQAELERALALEPGYADAYNNLGKAHYGAGRLADARAAWSRALELNPNLAQTHNNLGSLAARQGDLAEAETRFRRALALEPDYRNAMTNLARVLALTGRSAEAGEWDRQAGSAGPAGSQPDGSPARRL